tara:strand:- start:4081 stop:4962 length:882 start_codon:yes stop_codon:yes gene_type:complete
MTDVRTISIALSGKWHGQYGTAPCPVCQPERRHDQNALSLKGGDKGILAFCHKSGCQFRDIAASLGLAPGTINRSDPEFFKQRERDRKAEAGKRSRQAQAVWAETQPITGTIAEIYLRGRGITCALGDTLRFHPAAWHGATAKRIPALVARIEGSDGFAIHRTYLQSDGHGKANIAPAKVMLGAMAGGAVRLTEGVGPLVVAEGIETALSLSSGLLGHPATIWAALSTSGMCGLRLPALPGRLTIAADGDAAGRKAAHGLAYRASAVGWAVSLLTAPDGRDWNDILIMKGAMQ